VGREGPSLLDLARDYSRRDRGQDGEEAEEGDDDKRGERREEGFPTGRGGSALMNPGYQKKKRRETTTLIQGRPKRRCKY